MLDLWTNTLLIRAEATHEGELDAMVVRPRVANAGLSRRVVARQSKLDPYGTQEFSDIVHQSWDVEIRGEATDGQFLIWLFGLIGISAPIERGMTQWELAEEASPPTFAMQVAELDGQILTYRGAALKQISLTVKARAITGWALTFQACRVYSDVAAWTATREDTGRVMAGQDARVAFAAAFTQGVAPTQTDCFEATLEITLDGQEPARFSPDGYPTAHQGGVWDIVGQIIIPEQAGVTDTALHETFPAELALWLTSGAGNRLELQAGVTAACEQRLAISPEWRQAVLAFVSRRQPGYPVAKIFRLGNVFS